MPRFEVFCPASPPALPADVTVQVDAENWLAALKAGLLRAGDARPTSHILCDVQADGSIHVAEPQGGGVFRIRELREAAPAASAPAPTGPGVARAGPTPAARSEPVAAAPPARGPAAPPEARLAGLERILDLAMEKLDAESGSVLLLRPGGRELEFVVARGPKAQELLALFAVRKAVPVGDGIVGTCVRDGVAIAVSDARRDRRFLSDVSLAIGYETRSILCAPIAREGGQTLGALEVLNRRGGAPFGAGDLETLAELARGAAEHLARLARG